MCLQVFVMVYLCITIIVVFNKEEINTFVLQMASALCPNDHYGNYKDVQ